MNSLLHFLIESMGTRTGLAVLVVADVLAVIVVPSILMRRRGRPLSAVAWLFAVFALPYLGVLAWWSVGLARFRRRRDGPGPSYEAAPGPRTGRLARLVPACCPGVAVSRGNAVELLVDGQRAFACMEEAIDAASSRIDGMFYIWKDDEVGQGLVQRLAGKAREKVPVRLLLDAGGSPLRSSSLFAPLLQAGGAVANYLPYRFRPWAPSFNQRNHRKLLLADRDAFVGGMNIGREYQSAWHDLLLRVRGPAVADLAAVFEDDWAFATRASPSIADEQGTEALPDPDFAVLISTAGEGPDAIHDAAFLAISTAQRRVLLTTPYFVPPPQLLAALRGAAQRGLDVRVLTAGRSDVPLVKLASRPFQAELGAAGVRLFEYTARVLHAKYLVVDDDISLFGSSNLDRRSLTQDLEVSCMSVDADLNTRLAECFFAALEHSVEVTRRTPPEGSELVEAAAHLLSPFL